MKFYVVFGSEPHDGTFYFAKYYVSRELAMEDYNQRVKEQTPYGSKPDWDEIETED